MVANCFRARLRSFFCRIALPLLFLNSPKLISAQEAPSLTSVPYQSPGEGFLSLALFNKDGVLVRTLLSAEKVTAGSFTVPWDYTSDLGIAVPPGNYVTKGIFFTNQPQVEYVMKVGTSGNPPYRTKDGKGGWGGNLAGPASITSNGKSVIMTWMCVEDPQITGVQEMDNNGNLIRRYYTFYPWDVRCASAMDGTNFFLGIVNGNKKQLEIASYTLGRPQGKILTALPTRIHADQTETKWRGRV